MEHGGCAVLHEISIQSNEENEKEPLEGYRLNSGTRNEISAMELDQDLMEQQLQAIANAEGVKHTPEMQAGSKAAPQTTEKVAILQFAEVVTGKEFVLPDARVRSRRDQVSGLTATKTAAMRTECKRVGAGGVISGAVGNSRWAAGTEGEDQDDWWGAVGGRHFHGVGMRDSYAQEWEADKCAPDFLPAK